MQEAPVYDSVVLEVRNYLAERVNDCVQAGVGRTKIVIDPGFGFGKTLQHNLQLLARLEELVALGYPVLVGMSRKSMIGQVLNRPVDQRVAGGLALASLAVAKGVRLIRTHDVAATVDAIRMTEAVVAGGTQQ